MLTITFVFEVHGATDECMWRSINLREASIGNFEAFSRSTAQRVFELVAFKQRKEATLGGRVSAKDLARTLLSNVTQAGPNLRTAVSEPIGDTALTVDV